MSINIFNPATGQTASAPDGTPVPLGWQVMTQNSAQSGAQAPQIMSSSGNGVAPNVGNLIASLRTQIASGALTGQQAMGALQSQLNAAQTQAYGKPSAFDPSQYASQLYAPLSITKNGQSIGKLNQDGSITQSAATINKTNVEGNSISTGTTYQNSYAGADPNVTLTPEQQASNAAILAQNGQGGNASANTTGTTGTGAGTAGAAGTIGAPASTGNPSLDALQSALLSQLNGQLNTGMIINSNLTITPALAQQFINQAATQLAPNERQILSNEITNVNAQLAIDQQQYETQQAISQGQFQQNLLGERGNAAVNGTAGSGQQGQYEQYLQSQQNLALKSLDLTAASQIGNTLRSTAADLGTNTLPGLNQFGGQAYNLYGINTPTLMSQTASLGGTRGGSNQNGSVNLNYNPSQYQYGNLLYGNGGYAQNLVSQGSQLLSNYLTSAANAPTGIMSGNNTLS